MAPAQIALPTPLPQPSTHSLPQSLRHDTVSLDDTPIRTVDALVRHRARINPHATIVSYPSSGVDFVDYSMQQLDVFAYRVARHYQASIPLRSSSKVTPTVVAVLGPSNFEYLVTMLALTKMGHTVLFLSTRISKLAVETLIETTGATYLLADARYLQLATNVQKTLPSLHVDSIAGSSVFQFPIEVHADTRMDYQLDPSIEETNNIYIIHSSGMCNSDYLHNPVYPHHPHLEHGHQDNNVVRLFVFAQL
jgi:acyl-CoA synthetase (AMP-forming)/AMP-acid ligase II